MIKIDNSFIESMTIPLILVDSKGAILKMNNLAGTILNKMGFSKVQSISEVDIKFNTKVLHDKDTFNGLTV